MPFSLCHISGHLTSAWLIMANGLEFEQTLGDSEEQESLVCCSPWGYKESDMTKRLNTNKTTGDTNLDQLVKVMSVSSLH